MNKDSIKQRLLEKRTIDPDRGCWEFTGAKTGLGYGTIKYNAHMVLVHRLSMYIYKGFSLTDKSFCCHSCDNKKCFNPDHIFLGTCKDNVRDCIKKGRKAIVLGQDQGNSKLKNDQIPKIRKLLSSGVTQKEISKKFRVHQSTISDIKTGRKWGWLKG
jgi:hypothetical protein